MNEYLYYRTRVMRIDAPAAAMENPVTDFPFIAFVTVAWAMCGACALVLTLA